MRPSWPATMLLTAWLAWPLLAWALEPEVQEAKDEGMRLYGLGISGEIIPYLEPAAEAGDVEAMYYYQQGGRT